MTPTPPLDLTKPMQNEIWQLLNDIAYESTQNHPKDFPSKPVSHQQAYNWGFNNALEDVMNRMYVIMGASLQPKQSTAPTITPWTAATMPWPCRVRRKGWHEGWCAIISAGAGSVGLNDGHIISFDDLLENFDHVLPNGETGACGVAQ